ncbi:MAG: insulinase family protein [Gammaproteobacteria bacterium]|nr:insulinase family protein [Gammaproteobacteria bacterium]
MTAYAENSAPTLTAPRRLAALALWATCFAFTHNAAAAPQIQQWDTANGARVYFVQAMELPMVDIQLVFDAGSARDGGRPGLALLANTLLDDGAGELDADDIAAGFEDLGAQFGTSSLRDMGSLTLRSLSDHRYLDPALDLFALILRSPTFPADALERERNRMLVALQSQEQSPEDIADNAFFRAIYRDHPYASDPLGTPESLQTLDRKDIENFYREYYVARNAVISLVGALERKDAERVAQRLADGLAAGSRAAPLPAVTPLEEAVTVHVEYPSSQTHVQVGAAGMTRDDPDYYALYVGNHVLGGSGLVSRISTEIREKRGLAYSAYSYFSPMRAAGPYTLGLQTRGDQAAQAVDILGSTLAGFIKDGPTAAEITASKRNITGGFPLRIASNSGIAGNLAMIGFYDLPLDYLDRFNERVEAVTAEQIRDAFQRRVHPGRMVTVTVGTSAP